MTSKLFGIVLMITLIIALFTVVNPVNASPCGDPLDPQTATVYNKHYHAESDITIALMSFRNCNNQSDQLAIAFTGQLSNMSFDQVDLYTLPNGDNRGDFDSANGKHLFWIFNPNQQVTLSNSTSVTDSNNSHGQAYSVTAQDASFELLIDSTDRVLLQNGTAFIDTDFHIATQQIDGRWYYFPVQFAATGTYIQQYTVYMPNLNK